MKAKEQDYNDAVAFATKWLAPRIREGRYVSSPVEPTEFIYMFGFDISQEKDDREVCSTFYRVPDDAIHFLIGGADVDKGAFDLVNRILATRVFRDEPMTDLMRIYIGQRVAGIRRSPNPESARISRSFARIFTLYSWLALSQKSTGFVLLKTTNLPKRESLVLWFLKLSNF